jgi:crotonobetainyl-CoA:carnitine CoA-transferase CaiB-like acyl-CoA transferase
MAGPLQGLRVIDLSRVLAGPLCAKTLTDLGADVIKIEPPRADVSRFSAPTNPNGVSGYYAQQNSGKRNISLDLNLAEGRELAMRLCETADIIVENFRPGTLGFFGLDYARVAARNPKVIYVSISGYGQGGPWASRMAYAATVQAEIGFTAHTKRHFGDDLKADRTDSLSHADVYTGLQAAIGVLAALNRLHGTGKGQHIDVSMAATIMSINEHAHVDLSDLDSGDEFPILGATDGVFFNGPGGERFISAISLINNITFRFYMAAMRRPDLIDDPRFSSAAARREHLTELHALVQSWMLTFQDMASLDAQLDEAKIAIGEMRSLQDVADTEWASYWGAVDEVSDRNGGTFHLPGRPWHFSDNELDPPGDPAIQGEHNHSICAELGMSEAQIDAYTSSKVLVGNFASQIIKMIS